MQYQLTKIIFLLVISISIGSLKAEIIKINKNSLHAVTVDDSGQTHPLPAATCINPGVSIRIDLVGLKTQDANWWVEKSAALVEENAPTESYTGNDCKHPFFTPSNASYLFFTAPNPMDKSMVLKIDSNAGDPLSITFINGMTDHDQPCSWAFPYTYVPENLLIDETANACQEDANPSNHLNTAQACYGCPGLGAKCANYPHQVKGKQYIFDSSYHTGGYWLITACW